MAEGGAPKPAAKKAGLNQQIAIIATVVTVVVFTVLLISIRSCSSSQQKEGSAISRIQQNQPTSGSHTVIYSNLDLKDAALVITRLKELKIPYQIKDEGRAIAVPKGKADEARLGLAEKNLPAGGSVGWEIFDQSKLGATDFDRRIQFIRAMSGELARTINRINVVEDTRMQIVIPETKLFEVSKAPVTASVLIKMKPGETLTQRQVNGIVRLVAGSVENLQPENITIIDVNGNVLSGGGYTPETGTKAEVELRPVLPVQKTPEKTEQVVIQNEEEKAAAAVKEKLDLEEKLTAKVQSLLNRMFPPNITIARVNVDSIENRKTSVIILLDKKFKMTQAIKKTTFETVSAAVGYDKARGDKIIMKSVTFHAAFTPATPAEKTEVQAQSAVIKALKWLYRKFGMVKIAAFAAGLFIFAVLGMAMLLGRGKSARPAPVPGQTAQAIEAAPSEERDEEEVPIVQEMKRFATSDPEKAAQLIRGWLAEEGV